MSSLTALDEKNTLSSKSKLHARENLEWYIVGLTALTCADKKQKRRHGWKIVTELLSTPISREIISDWHSDGKLILDRTHHMRTVETEKNGNNALFELRKVFNGKDRMFVEFISEAYKLCSFTVSSPWAFKKLMEVTKSANEWAADPTMETQDEPGASKACLVPHFRIEAPSAEVEDSGYNLQLWKETLELTNEPFALDLVLKGSRPNLFWACNILHSHSCAMIRATRVQFDDEALRERFQSIDGDEALVTKAKQLYKALIVAEILPGDIEIRCDKAQKLLTQIVSFKEGLQMLEMSHELEDVDKENQHEDEEDPRLAQRGVSEDGHSSETVDGTSV